LSRRWRGLKARALTEHTQIAGWDTRVVGAFEPVEPAGAKSVVPSPRALAAAESWLRRGVPVVIPTETVYGLAAPAPDRRAVSAVFAIKGRPQDNPLIVHVTRETHLAAVGARLSPLAVALARRFWPGPLTLVVSCGESLPWVTAGLDSVAVRHPAHAFAAALIDRVGPLAAPSANLSGRPSPTRAGHATRDLSGRVPLVVDGGDLEHGLESTVLDVRGERPVLLRPGALPLEMIESACERSILTATSHGSVRSPGMKYRHYSPRAELWLYPVAVEEATGAPASSSAPTFATAQTTAAARLELDARRLTAAGRRVAAIARQPVDVERFIAQPEPRELGRALFRWLLELDELGVDCILVEGVALAGVGRAVMDRLTRAAAHVRGASTDLESLRTFSA
jgi:L-threonylcarbamoyladenylate synthase